MSEAECAETASNVDERDILVIVPAYRKPDELKQCLEAVGSQTISNRIAVYVRDNSDDNIYFTAAINEGLTFGIEQKNFRFFLLLNQDCYLERDAVEKLVDFLNQYTAVGIAAPLQLHSRKPEWVVWGGSGPSFPAGIQHGGPIARFQDSRLTPWANGAAMMIRREVLVQIGLLDENMRFSYSDSDYSLTARSRGWQIVCVTEAKCVHESGDSLEPKSPEIVRQITKDGIYFADKWFSGLLFQRLENDGNCDLNELRADRQFFADALEQMLPGNFPGTTGDQK